MADYAHYPGDKYVLPRNESEFERLNLQHKYISNAVFDGGLVFDKSIKFDEKCRVLDSGTGTGIWAIEFANGVPGSVEIHGCDVSEANFTPNPPNNVHLSVASVSALPSGWSNRFDFVNQRLLFGALVVEEWNVALLEIYRVLKPGGTVQLCELDGRSLAPETPFSVQIRDATWRTFDGLGLRFDVAVHLSKMLERTGFVDIVEDVRRLPVGKTWGEIGVQGTIALGGGLRNACGTIVKAGAVSSKEEYESLMDEVEEEWDIHGNNYPCYVVCARKPFLRGATSC